jgi:formylglycine-generating enzyme required for sulfatase activity/tRNA A-37 threonylcarbamoyl transferase component Bud32
MPLSFEQFASHLVDSRLMTAAEIDSFVAALAARPADGEHLARELVKQKKLTAYQAQQIYSGKGMNLVLGNYRILDKLGQGGMDMVLKAEHQRMKRLVALKMLSPKVTKSSDALRRFQREVEAAAKLRHPNIVAADDADEAQGVHFLVMEYIEGSDLAAWVKKHGVMPLEKAIQCILQAARGLEYAHRHGVVHRDIKPANLLLDNHGTIKILDMGLARLDSAGQNQDELTGTGQIMGTVDYMAPEQAVNTRQADARADIYSLGVTLWYLLTGRAMYQGDSAMAKLIAHQNQPIPSLRAHGASVSPALDAVFVKMVAKASTDRYQSMTEMIAELERLQSGGAVAPSPSSTAGEDTRLEAFLRGMGEASTGDGAAATRTYAAVAPAAASAVPDVTIDLGRPQADTNPQLPRPAIVTAGRRAARFRVWPSLPPRNRWLVAAAAGGALALLLGIWVIVRDKDGNEVGRMRVPEGGKVEVGAKVTSAESSALSTEVARSDRVAAEKALSLGGAVAVNGKIASYIRTPEQLPNEPFRLSAIEITRTITDADCATFEPCTGLSILGLHNTKVGDAGVYHFRNNKDLTRLILAGTKISDTGLAHFRDCARSLVTLRVQGTDVTEAGLASFKDATKLMELGLGGSKLSDRSLAHFRQCSRLQNLELYRMELTDRGLESIQQYKNFSSLSLDGTPINGAAIERLSRITSLRSLKLANITGLTAASLEPLAKALPRCRITLDGRAIESPAENPPVSPIASAAPAIAVAPFDAAQAKKHQEAWAKHLATTVETTNSVGAKMILIPPGEFLMGSSDEQVAAVVERAEPNGNVDPRPKQRIPMSELPQHRMVVSAPLRMAATEVTIAQFRKFADATGYVTEAEQHVADVTAGRPVPKEHETPFAKTWRKPRYAYTDESPVAAIGFRDAMAYCQWLSEQEKAVYRLPSEAEWEFACRAGATSQYFFGDDDSQLKNYGWYSDNEGIQPHPVAQLAPNPFGLYDMPGNVYELCRDYYETQWYRRSTPDMLTGPAEGAIHSIRGGSYFQKDFHCRSAHRWAAFVAPHLINDIGFRVVCEVAASATQHTPSAPSPPGAVSGPPRAIAPFDAAQATKHQEAWAKHLGPTVETTDSLGMKLVLIPPGDFLMGSTDEQVAQASKLAEQNDDHFTQRRIELTERPQHRVTLARAFRLGAMEVTLGQFKQFTAAAGYRTEAEVLKATPVGERPQPQSSSVYRTPSGEIPTWLDPGYAVSVDSPAAAISWNDAIAFCQWLSERERATYRLPTEAEWEYACRAGTTTHYWFGDEYGELDRHAWYGGNANKRTHPVGQKLANPFGLFDITGNVLEWCQDFFNTDWYSTSPAIDPINSSGQHNHMIRGGSAGSRGMSCRSAERTNWNASEPHPYAGFRVVREIAAAGD